MIDMVGRQAFEKHVNKVHNSAQFKDVAKQAQPFLNALKDFAFGRELSLENMVMCPRPGLRDCPR